MLVLAAVVSTTSGIAQVNSGGEVTIRAAGRGGRYLNFQDGRRIQVDYQGDRSLTEALESGLAQPHTLAVADIDANGTPDLIAGYSLNGTGIITVQRGNPDAFAPRDESIFTRVRQGYQPPSLQSRAETYAVPEPVDFLGVGDFTGEGHKDVLTAARGGGVYLLTCASDGTLGAPERIDVPGQVTALAVGDFGLPSGKTSVVVGVLGPNGPAVLAYTGAAGGLKSAPEVYPLRSPVVSLSLGRLDDDRFGDALAVTTGELDIIHGGGQGTLNVELLEPGFKVQAATLGDFVKDRDFRLEMALLASDGRLHVLQRSDLDTRPYTEEEQRYRMSHRIVLPEPGAKQEVRVKWSPEARVRWTPAARFETPAMSAVRISPQALLVTAHLSPFDTEDILALDGAGNQVRVVTDTPGLQAAAVSHFIAPLQRAALSLDVDSAPVAIVGLPRKINGTHDVAVLSAGHTAPSFLRILPTAIFSVNTTSDHAPDGACNSSPDCTLREAVIAANASPGSTINLPSGTFQLTRDGNSEVGNCGDASIGDLDADPTVTITGNGSANTIIQQTINGDRIICLDQNVNGNRTYTLTGLTFAGGRETHGVGGGGIVSGAIGDLTVITDCVITNSRVSGGGSPVGGGFGEANGSLTVSGSTFGGTTTVAGCASQLSLNCGNSATGSAGGLYQQGSDPPAITFSVTASPNGPSIFQNNTTGNGGGAINSAATGTASFSSITISDSTFTSNVATSSTSRGGAIRNESVGAATPMNITACTFVSNSVTGTSGAGGAIASADGANHNVNVSLSRFVGNTTATASNGLAIFGGSSSSMTANNDWWASNVNPTTNNTAAGTVTLANWLVLRNFASPSKIRILQSSTMTGDFLVNSAGTAIAPANLTVLVGLPITFDGAILGSIPQAQPETLNASAQATATFNAGGVSGRGTANATVDSFAVAANSNSITSATEAGTTVTITTAGTHGHAIGDSVVISGVGVSGYNGTFIITGVTPTTFTYTNVAGLGASSGGTARVGIVILEPPQITKTFGAASIPINGTTTATFSINNPNIVTINASFTDTLPAGLLVAATPGVVSTCGAGVTANAGSNTISFANSSLPVGVCTISVNITGTADNNYTNSVQILSSDAGNGNTSSANLTVINPPHIIKAFGAATIPLNGTTGLTLTIDSNGNSNLTLNGVAFTDSLPSGLVVATPSNVSTTCSGGTATATSGTSTVSLSGASVPPISSCTVTLNVQGTTAGGKTNNVQVTSTNAGTGNTASASITVVVPPTVSKAFGAPSIALNGTTSLTLTVSNPNTTAAGDLTGVAVSDSLPAGLVVATPANISNTCNGTVTATPGSGVVSLSGGSVVHSGSCSVQVDVTGTAAGAQLNTTGAITSTEGGTGTTSNTATIHVEAPPSIAKAFGATAIPVNGTTSLTFTITNPAANVDPLTGVGFNDTLPLGLTVASATSTPCSGTLTTTAPTSIALSGATVVVGTPCTFSVTVTGATSGQYTNTTGVVSSTNGGTGNTASAGLTVATPPSITKGFGAGTLLQNGTTSLTFNIQNPNAGVALTGVAFTDSLPAGLVVAPVPNLNNACGGTATAVAGSGSVSLSGGALAASAGCTVSVDVQGTTGGLKINSVQVNSTEGGTGNTSSASVTVIGAPSILKSFGAASIPLSGSTSLSFTLQNNNATTLTGVGFSDTLPGGLTISTPNGLIGSCGGGAITATQGTSAISLAGATLAGGANCTFSVNVTGTAAGLQNNTTGNVTSNESGPGGVALASTSVEGPPSIAKTFSPSAIPVNGTTSLTFTITNPAANTQTLDGVAFNDTLPAALTVATATSTVCGGTFTTTAPNTIALSGAAIGVSGQCTFSVTVTGTAAGQYTNTTGPVSSTNGGTGNTASASVSVAAAPTISKAFGAASILTGSSTSLTFNIHNPNTGVALTGVAFSDTLPAGLAVATPSGLTSNCGGTTTATAGSGSASLTGGSLAANGSCTIAINVSGITAGVQNNTTGPISATESGAGATSNTASITVIGPPSIAKVFGAASIPLNGSTTLTFTISNPNATVALTGLAFTDNLPAGVAVAAPNGLTGSCGAGTITTSSSSVALNGGTIAAGGSCTFGVNVNGTASGNQVNTTSPVTSSNAGTGNTATASVLVHAVDLTITKTHAGNFQIGQSGATYTIAVTNAGNIATSGTVTVTDALPAGLTATAISGTGWTCTLATLICTRSDALAPGTSYPAITLTVNVANNAGASVINSATVSGGGDVNAANNTATDPTTITPLGPDLTIAKSHAAAFTQGETGATYSITVTNSGGSGTSGSVTVADALPAGLTATAITGTGWTCTLGTLTCTRSDALAAAASYPAITLTVDVSSSAPPSVTNSVTVSGGGDVNNANNTATDVTPIGAAVIDLSIAKTHGGIFFVGQIGASYSIIVSNAGGAASLGTVTVIDTLPAGLTATAMTGAGWTCTLGTLTCTRSDVLAGGASYPAITLTVDVSNSAPASVTNTAIVSGGGDTNAVNNTANDVTSISPIPPIPMLSPELLLLLAAVLGFVAWRTMK